MIGVVDYVLTPQVVASFIMGLCGLGFYVTVELITHKSQHAEVRAVQAETAQQIGTATAEFLALMQEVRDLRSEFNSEQKFTTEMRKTAKQDRNRIEAKIDQLLIQL